MCVIVKQDVWSSVLTYTTHFIPKHLQYKTIANASVPSADTKVPMVVNIFTFGEDKKLFGYDLSFVNVLLML